MERLSAFTIDVEDYFQVSAFGQAVSPDNWDSFELRVEQNTHKILNICDEIGIKGTFFTLGWVAQRVPQLVKEISQRGHEIASHGYSHQLIYKQTPEVFKKETVDSKSILEDLAQTEVVGYRAASYSITRKSLWALDILSDAGFKYDSSIFPVHHDTYGIPDSPQKPYHIKTQSGASLIEFPLSAAPLGKLRMPVAGGGYFRLYPYWMFDSLVKRFMKETDAPYVFYLHPWEVDPDQPRIEASLLSKFRHYNNLDKCETRLKKFLRAHQFTTMQEVLNATEILSSEDGFL